MQTASVTALHLHPLIYLGSCCFSPLLRNLALRWRVWCLTADCVQTHNSPGVGGGHYLCFTCPPPPARARPVPPRRCSLRLLLIVSVSGCECATWWRVTFGRSDACPPLSPRQNGSGNWATEEESRCLLWGAGTKAGTHNGFSVRSRGSGGHIKGHKRLNGCKVCKKERGGGGVRWKRRPHDQARTTEKSSTPNVTLLFLLVVSCGMVSFHHSLDTERIDQCPFD